MNLYRNNLTIGSIPQLDVVVPEFFPKTGLVSYYKLDGNSNDAHGSNDGSASNISYEAGQTGQRAVFNGSSSLINCGNDASLKLTKGTISALIKTSNAGSGYRGIIVKQMAYGMFLSDNVLVAYSWDTGTEKTTGINLADGNLHWVVLEFDSGVSNGTKVYIDNVLKLTTTMTVKDQTVALSIGTGGSTATQVFTGAIEEVGIWSRHLTTDEKNTLYNSGTILTY